MTIGEKQILQKRRQTFRRVITALQCVAAVALLTAAVWGILAARRGDRTPPVLKGVTDITVEQGQSVSYRSGITVTDRKDKAPQLLVDTSQVNLSIPGVYTVTYTAVDASGNQRVQTATVTVLKKAEAPLPQQLQSKIDEVTDQLLEQILEEGMTAEQQVRAIYRWAQSTISYSGSSDRTDYRQTGYAVITDPAGDCYGYFAVTKLLFERLGIPNIDVVKVKNSDQDSSHFWSMVSVDGGQTYYHFDATPRVGDGDDFCLVTDEFLDNYSDRHNKCHNRDRSLYPATPDDPL